MKRKAVAAVLALMILLSGCNTLWDGEYSWVEKYPLPHSPESGQPVAVATYEELKTALKNMVERGRIQSTVSVADYPAGVLETDLAEAVRTLRRSHPITAYAVEDIIWEIGTSAGEPVVALQIAYFHDRAEIRNIKTVDDHAAAAEAVYKALTDCQPGIVLQIKDYTQTDFTQLVADYAMEHPETVMELPQVTENIYPESGQTRVVELKFSYQTSRESLKNMQSQVSPVFSSAVLYVSGDGPLMEKYGQLYSFLMERYEYTIETSITPTYSLLRHGVGDSRAFAMVYAAMCRMAGLECMVVSGTRDGMSHYWNIIEVDGSYCHVDLLRCSTEAGFSAKFDSQMTGYVWDYSAYPESVLSEAMQQEK